MLNMGTIETQATDFGQPQSSDGGKGMFTEDLLQRIDADLRDWEREQTTVRRRRILIATLVVGIVLPFIAAAVLSWL